MREGPLDLRCLEVRHVLRAVSKTFWMLFVAYVQWCFIMIQAHKFGLHLLREITRAASVL